MASSTIRCKCLSVGQALPIYRTFALQQNCFSSFQSILHHDLYNDGYFRSTGIYSDCQEISLDDDPLNGRLLWMPSIYYPWCLLSNNKLVTKLFTGDVSGCLSRNFLLIFDKVHVEAAKHGMILSCSLNRTLSC